MFVQVKTQFYEYLFQLKLGFMNSDNGILYKKIPEISVAHINGNGSHLENAIFSAHWYRSIC